MKQWIIDRYNKKQRKYEIDDVVYSNEVDEWVIYFKGEDFSCPVLYDFLFNPKWGFAKAFWEGYSETWDGHQIEAWVKHLQQMAISEDPLEYLERFREEK